MFTTYTINNFLNQSSTNKETHFHIDKLGNSPSLYEGIIMPCKNNFHELVLIINGTTKYKVDYKDYNLNENSFFYLAQGQLYARFKINKQSFEGYILRFTEDFFQDKQTHNIFLFGLKYLKQIIQNPLIQFSKEESTLIFMYFELLYQEFQRVDHSKKILEALLYLFLLEFKRLRPINAIQEQQNSVFKQFVKLLEQQFAYKWSASDYAKALHISPRHLNRIIQQETKKNLTSVIQDRSILEAKRLLTFSDLTIREIATQLGFEDSAYFARFFRKKTNSSPTGFRKKVKSNA